MKIKMNMNMIYQCHCHHYHHDTVTYNLCPDRAKSLRKDPPFYHITNTMTITMTITCI